ncbi:hypothetical protein S7335_1137 [Synechococcus sp. PCC 7335]|uniref:hypothetical protein n=1 Tax=Synechococcus sp. (strain ATCC 29403 / PCC 7335) TaxID=91464 RepID=UPI00017EE84B|nr:hypothetical protein [Synechococcus sp. PCC 7335]EDX82433.1 hypothetical protein S7335_1137 [Synechococcus sp. PCC 7335]
MKKSIILFICTLFTVVGFSNLPIHAQVSNNTTSQIVVQLTETEQSFVDTAVGSILESRPTNGDSLEIWDVRVSSDGLYAMVYWTLDPAGGVTLLRKVDNEIQIVEEGGGALRQSDIERAGVPSEAAAEIASDWGQGQ